MPENISRKLVTWGYLNDFVPDLVTSQMASTNGIRKCCTSGLIETQLDDDYTDVLEDTGELPAGLYTINTVSSPTSKLYGIRLNVIERDLFIVGQSQVTRTITLVGDNGITLTGNASVDDGDSYTFTYTFESGFALDSLVIYPTGHSSLHTNVTDIPNVSITTNNGVTTVVIPSITGDVTIKGTSVAQNLDDTFDVTPVLYTVAATFNGNKNYTVTSSNTWTAQII